MDSQGTDQVSAKILVVDDDPTVRLMARASLEPLGYEVEEAEDGVKCLECVKRFQPDLILLDVQMPEMDGFEVCAELRRAPEHMEMPILMITGLEDTNSIERAFDVGATDFVTKPVNWKLLSYHVRYVLRASRLEQELQETKNLLEIARLSA